MEILIIKTSPLGIMKKYLEDRKKDKIDILLYYEDKNIKLPNSIHNTIIVPKYSGFLKKVKKLFFIRNLKYDEIVLPMRSNKMPFIYGLSLLFNGSKKKFVFTSEGSLKEVSFFSISTQLFRSTPKGFFNYLLSSLSLKMRSTYVLGKPINLTIEPTNFCNLRCPICETGLDILNRPKGRMTLDNFKKIIDNVGGQVNSIMFYFMGETFLNKESYDIIKYAKSKGIFIETCTNGDIIDPMKLVESRIDKVEFQLGGLTQETHQKYRVNGDLEKTIENARISIKERNKKGLLSPEIHVNLILMKHNEHEIQDFFRLVEEIGADEGHIINPCVRTIEQANEMLPSDEKYIIYNTSELKKGKVVPNIVPNNRCDMLYYSTVIMWDGSVVPCCRDPTGKYIMGNAIEEDFKRIWNNRKYRTFRKNVFENQKDVDLCKLCSSYGKPDIWH